MELLYQSNPTLIPMRGFDMEMYVNHHYEIQQEESQQQEEDDEDILVMLDDMDNIDDDDDNDNGDRIHKVTITDAPQSFGDEVIAPYSPAMDNNYNNNEILRPNNSNNTNRSNQMKMINITDTAQQSNTITYGGGGGNNNGIKSPNTPNNITPAPSNAMHSMKLMSRDSGYEDEEDDDDMMVYMVQDDDLGMNAINDIQHKNKSKQSLSSQQRQKSNNEQQKMVTFAPNESSYIAQIVSGNGNNYGENSQTTEKLNLYHASATIDSEVP